MSGTPAAASGASSNKPPVFLDQPNAALFTVVSATKELSRQVTPKITIHAYRVVLQVDKSLPPISEKSFEIKAEIGEGTGSEQLDVQEWIPVEPGQKCVLAFDATRMRNANRTISLSAGETPEQAWKDVDRYYHCLANGSALDAGRVAQAITQKPRPLAAFFQLVFRSDRSVLSNASGVRALTDYTGDAAIPPLERRKVVAHFMPPPDAPKSCADLADAMLNLALELDAAGEGDSAGVLFERIDGFFKDRSSNAYVIRSHATDVKRRDALLKLAGRPTAGVRAEVQRDLKTWLSG